MNELAAVDSLQSLGISWPTPAYLIGMILFSLIGMAAFRYGKKAKQPIVRWIGLALMLYSYATPTTWSLYLLGVALCAGLYWFHK